MAMLLFSSTFGAEISSAPLLPTPVPASVIGLVFVSAPLTKISSVAPSATEMLVVAPKLPRSATRRVPPAPMLVVPL